MTALPEPPPVSQLSRAQFDGWACCWCGKDLLDVPDAVSAGIARGRAGAHVLDIEVYACPGCAQVRSLVSPSTAGAHSRQ